MEEEVMVVEQLLPRRRRAVHLADDEDGSESSDDMMINSISDEKSVYFDNKQDTKLQWSDEAKISKLVNAVINHQNIESEILSVSSTANNIIDDHQKLGAKKENVTIQVVEESDGEEEEEIELEFERAVEKVHTHTPYCPNCRNRITKVILRRKKRTEKPLDLLGCFRCFAVFIPSGDCLNPFGGLFNPTQKPKPPKVEASTDNAQGYKPKPESPTVEPPTHAPAGTETIDAAGQPKPEHRPLLTYDIEAGPNIEGGRPLESVTVNINVGDPVINQQRSRSLEILKCIVYGGLMESIASLSIVSSAAASDATTSNVVVIGLATLFSGLIVFGSNLVELQNENSTEKYERVLGRKGHFAFHSTFAVLSYLVFGLIAPITYGFAFRESGDKDYKILAVAAAAFGSVFLLSIAKAYASRGRDGYVKTTLCYIMLAVSASGVAYAAGDVIGNVLNNVGMFRDVPAPGWASY